MEIGSLHIGMLMSVIKNSLLFQTFMREDAGAQVSYVLSHVMW